MSLVTAIKSFVTPTRHYENNRFYIIKQLMPNGSTNIMSFHKDGHLFKLIIREPIDTFTSSKNASISKTIKNILTVGHRTRVKNFEKNTETTINMLSKRFESPVHNTLDTDGELLYSISELDFFHNLTKIVNGDILKSFDIKKQKDNIINCLEISYNNGNISHVKRYNK